jgi:hypothetical protein
MLVFAMSILAVINWTVVAAAGVTGLTAVVVGIIGLFGARTAETDDELDVLIREAWESADTHAGYIALVDAFREDVSADRAPLGVEVVEAKA